MNSLTKLITIFLSGLILALGVQIFLVKPNLAKVAALGTDIKIYEIKLETIKQQVSAFKSAQADLARAEKKDAILNATLQRENLVFAIKNIEDYAFITATELSTRINEPDPKSKIKIPEVINGKIGLSEIPYNLNTISDFAGAVRFLQYLEHLPYFTEISRIDLTAEVIEVDKRSTQTGRVFGSIDAVFFVKGE